MFQESPVGQKQYYCLRSCAQLPHPASIQVDITSYLCVIQEFSPWWSSSSCLVECLDDMKMLPPFPSKKQTNKQKKHHIPNKTWTKFSMQYHMLKWFNFAVFFLCLIQIIQVFLLFLLKGLVWECGVHQITFPTQFSIRHTSASYSS